MIRKTGLRLAACGLALAALACASTPPTRFYVLAAPPDPGGETSDAIGVGVGPTQVPSYLDRPQIVTRTAANELRVPDFDQWGETLEEGISRTLADNLSTLLRTDRIDVFPWERSVAVDFRVAVDVIRFEREASGDVVLDARWQIFRVRDKRVVARRRSSHRASAGGGDYPATVAAMSEALASLSREVAVAVKGL